MRAHIATGMIGTFVFDNDGKVLAYTLFPKDPAKIAQAMEKIEKGEVLDQEKELVSNIAKLGYKEIFCDRAIEFPDMITVQKKDNIAQETMQAEFRKLALDLHWVNSQAELNEILSKIQVLRTREKLKTVKSDKILMQAIGVLDEIDKDVNTFSERMREWYGLYFPEATKLINSNEKLAVLISDLGDKNTIKAKYDGEAKNLTKYIDNSAGMDFSEPDMESVRVFAKIVIQLFDARKEIEEYIEKAAKTTIPNMTGVAGATLAARVLALAGGLEKMSRMPSSTVQLLGAEKALFRHLRGEGKAPKYGVLFGHPAIQNAPKELKGKVARMIAAKLSLASKTDFFTDKDKSEEYKKNVEESLKKLSK